MHADHHGGLYRLLEWRARRGCPPLLVVGPQRLFEVLVKYSSVVRACAVPGRVGAGLGGLHI